MQQRLNRESRRPKYTQFSQQELGSCKPLLTPMCLVFVYVFIGAICILVGIFTLRTSRSVVELKFRYDRICIMQYTTLAHPLTTNEAKSAFMQDYNKRKNCTISMDITKYMKQPIYVYYQLGNYFQNHRRYMKSKSERQLRGFLPSKSELNNCKPEDKVGGHVIVPCGLVAWSLFNDTFDLSTNAFYTEEGTLFVNKTAISYKSDREERFNNTVFPSANFVNNNRTTVANAFQIGGSCLNNSEPLSMDENLIVWMRPAALPTFRKLYGRIEIDLHPGTTLTININNFYNTYGFHSSKWLILSTMSWIGGKNDILGFSYLVVGCISTLLGFIFFFVHCKSPRSLGDKSYLSWIRKNTTIGSTSITM